MTCAPHLFLLLLESADELKTQTCVAQERVHAQAQHSAHTLTHKGAHYICRCIQKLIGQYKQPSVVLMIILNCCVIASIVAGQVVTMLALILHVTENTLLNKSNIVLQRQTLVVLFDKT